MINTIYTKIAFLGVTSSNIDSLLQIKIVNCITAMIIALMVIQIPLILILSPSTGLFQLCINVIFMCVFAFIPWLNQQGHFISARSLLMLCYVIYLAMSNITWGLNAQLHYFYLIAIFVSPFLYRQWEHKQIAINIILYAICFGFFQWFWLTGDQYLTTDQLWLQMVNSALLTSATIISSQLLFHNCLQTINKNKWQRVASEQLLRQTLPNTLANKLVGKQQNTVFEHSACQSTASVVFADMQNYTHLCKSKNNFELIALLHEFYQQMDDICATYQLEKIKTNGDQYMATCGVIESNPSSSTQCCLAGLAMLELSHKFSRENNVSVQLRIGIARGTVISGFVGKHTTQFDVWGDAVNIAARMESSGEINKIQVCDSTYHQCKDALLFNPRGEINLKGIGKLNTYWIAS